MLSIIRRRSGPVWRARERRSCGIGAGHGCAGDRQDRVHVRGSIREVIHNFNDDGFESLDAKYPGGRPPSFTLPQRQATRSTATSR